MSASVKIGSTTLSANVHVQRTGSDVSHTLITFAGMSGQEVIQGTRMYESYAITADISGTNVADVDTSATALETALYNLKGATDSTVIITYGDSSNTTISNAIVNGSPSYSPPFYRGTTCYRTVSFTVRRCR